jgi:hypothetical protein
MKFSTKYKCLFLFLLFIEFFALTNSKENKSQDHNFRKRKTETFKKSMTRADPPKTAATVAITAQPQVTLQPVLTKRLSDPDYTSLNHTFAKKNIKEFKDERLAYAKYFKIQSTQLDEIFTMFTTDDDKQHITTQSTRSSIKIFIENFELCDDNKNNVLTLIEFKACLKKNEYLQIFDFDLLTQPDFLKKIIENNKNYTALYDSDTFSTRIFNIVDENGNGFLNFYDFMILRLISFAWRKCANNGYIFIAEMEFECAIEIVAKAKTLYRNSLRTLFETALEISNFGGERQLDLPTFILISLNYRLYGKINIKSNGEIHKDQLDTALHSNNLPNRYDNEIVNLIPAMFNTLDRPDHAIDPHTFLFIDLILRLFKINQRENLVDYEGFVKILQHPMFPKKFIEEFYYVPKFSLTKESYISFVSGKTNKVIGEENFLLKKFRFKSKSERKLKAGSNQIQGGKAAVSNNGAAQTTTTTTVTQTVIEIVPQKTLFYLNFNTNSMKNFDYPHVSSLFFKLMDFPQQQKISFEEFYNLIQIMHIYKKCDINKSGKLNRELLLQNFKSYVGYPKPTLKILQRVDNLKLVPADTILNLFYTYGLFRVEDFKSTYTKQDSLSVLVNEVNLQSMLHSLSINEFPMGRLDSCISTHLDNQINISVPYYEWGCALGTAISIVSTLLQNEEDFRKINEHSLKLENTVFENFQAPVQIQVRKK